MYFMPIPQQSAPHTHRPARTWSGLQVGHGSCWLRNSTVRNIAAHRLNPSNFFAGGVADVFDVIASLGTQDLIRRIARQFASVAQGNVFNNRLCHFNLRLHIKGYGVVAGADLRLSCETGGMITAPHDLQHPIKTQLAVVLAQPVD